MSYSERLTISISKPLKAQKNLDKAFWEKQRVFTHTCHITLITKILFLRKSQKSQIDLCIIHVKTRLFIPSAIEWKRFIMSWILIFIITFALFAFSFSLWIRLTKVLDQNNIPYTAKVKKRILWEILFKIVRLLVLLFLVHWVLSLLQL